MRQHSTRLSLMFRIAALSAILAVLVPILMPVCAMAHDALVQNELPCHGQKQEVPPCHGEAQPLDAATELGCCRLDVAALHEEAVIPDSPSVPDLLVLLPFVVVDLGDDASGHIEPTSERGHAAPPVILPILFRSLLN